MGFWHTMIEVFPRFMPVLLDGAVIAVERTEELRNLPVQEAPGEL